MLGLADDVTIDGLEQRLLECEREVSLIRAEQVMLLAALDGAQVAQIDGSRSMVEWVAARLDVSHDTARLLTRTAKAVVEYPGLARRLNDGDIGVERVAATASLAGVAPPEVVERSAGWDLMAVGRMAGRYRGGSRRRDEQVFADRYLTLQPSLDAATVRGRFELPGFDGEILTAALAERSDLFSDAPGPRIPLRARMVDALVSIAQDSLAGVAPDGDPTRREPVVSIFVEAAAAAPSRGEAGAEVAAGARVGPAVLEEVLCSGKVGVIVLDDAAPVAATPTTRAIPPAIRRLVLFRDGACTIDGCRSRYRLQPHHLNPYAAGGSHHPDNLTTLCWYHHHVIVHGLGYRIDPHSPPGRRRFHRPNTGHDPPHA